MSGLRWVGGGGGQGLRVLVGKQRRGVAEAEDSKRRKISVTVTRLVANVPPHINLPVAPVSIKANTLNLEDVEKLVNHYTMGKVFGANGTNFIGVKTFDGRTLHIYGPRSANFDPSMLYVVYDRMSATLQLGVPTSPKEGTRGMLQFDSDGEYITACTDPDGSIRNSSGLYVWYRAVLPTLKALRTATEASKHELHQTAAVVARKAEYFHEEDNVKWAPVEDVLCCAHYVRDTLLPVTQASVNCALIAQAAHAASSGYQTFILGCPFDVK